MRQGNTASAKATFSVCGSYRSREEGTPPVGPFSACDFSRKPSPKVHSCVQRISFSHPARARSGSSPERHFLHEISSRSAKLGNVRAAHRGRRKPRRRFCLGRLGSPKSFTCLLGERNMIQNVKRLLPASPPARAEGRSRADRARRIAGAERGRCMSDRPSQHSLTAA